MPDRRLFDSSSLVTPPEPRVEAWTSNVETETPTDNRPGDRPSPPLRSILPSLRERYEYLDAGLSVRARLLEAVAAKLREKGIKVVPVTQHFAEPAVITVENVGGSTRTHDRYGERWFRVGDIVTRDGRDRQRVISTDSTGEDYAPTLIEVECIKEPPGWLNEDGTRESPWCRIGEIESNLARRYDYADDAIDVEATVIAGKLERR